jgi:hypothetical protein
MDEGRKHYIKAKGGEGKENVKSEGGGVISGEEMFGSRG